MLIISPKILEEGTLDPAISPLIIILEPLICERKLTSWDRGAGGPVGHKQIKKK